MLTRETLTVWLTERYASAHISDGGPVFWVDSDPEVGPLLVVKATGAAWRFGAEPAKRAVFGMPSEAVFRRSMRAAGLDPTQPHDVVPLELPPLLPSAAPRPVSPDEVVTWLRTRFDWQHIENRVTDIGWGYSINTQTDAFLDTGDPLQGVVGNGPIIVVKRTRGVWFFGSSPDLWPALDAATEADFYAARRAVFRRSDPHQPDQWLPLGGETDANTP
jgi:hypothetical protein